MTYPKIASYKLLTNIFAQGKSIEQISTEIFLPSKSIGRIRVLFYPNEQQEKQLEKCWEFSFSGIMKEENSDEGIRIVGEATVRETLTKPWPDGLTDRWMKVRITSLEIKQPLKTSNSSATFYLSFSSYLQPWKGFRHKLSGETKIYVNKKSKFYLGRGLKIDFDTHFKRIEKKFGGRLSFPELVGTYHNFKPSSEPSATLSKLDDFLLLVSFAERQRCVCVGWRYYDRDNFTKFYRRDIAIPKPTRAHINEAFVLIHKHDFKDFMKKAYITFNRSKKKDRLRQAIQRVVPMQKTIETSYMSLFSALETIMEAVLGPDNILRGRKFIELREEIKTIISKNRSYKKDQKLLINEKISELNRISFAARFSQLIEKLNYEDDDLWPMTDSSDGPSLQNIRHRLIHGRYLDPKVIRPVLAARNHLKWTLERLLLKMLGWNHMESTTSMGYLSHYLEDYKLWKMFRNALKSDSGYTSSKQ